MSCRDTGKKKRIGIIALIFFSALMIMGLYFGHTDIRVHCTDENNKNVNITDIQCSYENGKEIRLTRLFHNHYYHTAFIYGGYLYSFDIPVNGKTLSTEILVLKTNNWKHYNVDISIAVGKESETYNADVVVKINGMSYYSETMKDIEEHNIIIQTGP